MSLIRTNNRTLDGNQGRRNILHNGSMRVAQRGTSFDTLSSPSFCTDRWKISFAGLDGNVDADQTTTVPTGQGFANSLQIHMDASETSLDAADQINVHQRLEGQDLQHLLKGTTGAKKTVLSFWVRSSVASTYTLELYDNDNTRSISKTYTIDTADTWEKKVVVFDGDTTGTLGNDNNRSMDVRWWIDAGSNFTSGTLDTSWASVTAANRVSQTTGWLESTSPEFYLTGCQWEVGDTPTDFEHLSFSEELHACKRYYEEYNNDNSYYFAQGAYTASTTSLYQMSWEVEKRATPSVTLSAGSTFILTRPGSSNAAGGTMASGNRSRKNMYIQSSSNPSSSTTGHGTSIATYTNSYVKIDAEL